MLSLKTCKFALIAVALVTVDTVRWSIATEITRNARYCSVHAIHTSPRGGP
jgi:hypothetical protein